MKFAFVGNDRREASAGLTGSCPVCQNVVTPGQNSERMWMWFHIGRAKCDGWLEVETKWHREWKDNFPTSWQEISLSQATKNNLGVSIRSGLGIALELKQEKIRNHELSSRETRHRKMFWIVDCAENKNSIRKIKPKLGGWTEVSSGQAQIINFPEKTFPKDWLNSTVPVLFDFKFLCDGPSGEPEPFLICLLPGRVGARAVFFLILKRHFIESFNALRFNLDVEKLLSLVEGFWLTHEYSFDGLSVSCFDR